MRKILAVAMLAAMTALGGRAEDPKKEDPFREYKAGDADFKSTDERLEITDFRFVETKDETYFTLFAELNVKNISSAEIERASFHVALFDADRRLIETSEEPLREDFTQHISPKVAMHLKLGFVSKSAKKAKYWQGALVFSR